MAAYGLRAKTPEQYRAIRRKALLWLSGFIAGATIAAYSVTPWKHRFPHAYDIPGTILVLSTVGAFISLLALQGQRSNHKARASFQVSVLPEGVFRHDDRLKDMFLAREEIIGFRERTNKMGMTILTADPTRIIYVPDDLEGYAEFRAQIVAMGVPFDIAPEHARRLWTKRVMLAVLPLLVLFIAARIQRSGTNPIMNTVAAVVSLCVLIWFEHSGRRNLAKSQVPWLWLIAINVFVLANEIMRIWHYRPPPLYRRVETILYLMISIGALAQWLWQKRMSKKKQTSGKSSPSTIPTARTVN